MKINEERVLMRIYLSETEKHHGKPVYEQIVLKARELKLAGATVLRGIMGFGAHSQLHTAKLLRLNEELPVVIEIVDSQENLEKLHPFLDKVVYEGLVTIENVRAYTYLRTGEAE